MGDILHDAARGRQSGVDPGVNWDGALGSRKNFTALLLSNGDISMVCGLVAWHATKFLVVTASIRLSMNDHLCAPNRKVIPHETAKAEARCQRPRTGRVAGQGVGRLSRLL